MYRRNLLTTLIFSLVTLPLWAQSDIQFHHIRTKGNVVKAVYSDVNGIVWLGTSSGLFSLPQLESRNPNAYQRPFPDVNTCIKSVTGDDQGRLWINTLFSNVFVYDPQCSEFTEDVRSLLDSRGIRVEGNFSVAADEDGNWWAMEANNLYWLDGEKNCVRSYSTAQDDRVLSVCKNSSLAVFQTKSELCFISLKDGRLIRRVLVPERYRGSGSMRLTEDGRLYIWLDYSVGSYDFVEAKWLADASMPSYVTGVERDSQQHTWVSTQATGIFVYDRDGKLLHHLQHHVWNANSLQSDHVDMIHYEQGSQTMWVAYAKGGLSVCNSRLNHLLLNTIVNLDNLDSGTDVLTFAPAGEGRGMWVGLEKRGVYLVDERGASHVIADGFTTALHTAADGSLWAGFYLGGLLHRTSDGHLSRFFEGRSPYAITEDENGCLFVALLGKGVWRLNPLNGETEDTHLVPQYVFDLKYHHHKLYAATTEAFFVGDGLANWERVYDGDFRSVLIDDKGYIWLLGSEGRKGLTIITPDGRRSEVPEDLKTAPLKNISLDGDGNVWIATSTELLMLRHDDAKPETLVRKTFNINSADEEVFYNYHASIVDADGRLWLGTTTGYQRIDTRKLVEETQQKAAARHLVLGAVSINDNLLSPRQTFNGRELVASDIVFMKELNLKYNENNLVIECSQSYADGFATDMYYYQVKGLSDVWYPMKDMTIVLPNMSPGRYQLLTRTLSSKPSRLLTIHIASPLWRSWWAWLCYLLMAVGIAYTIIRYYRNKRAYQIQLREIQLQQEQQRQMNEMKLRFFTNISHDLRTPLSLILGPVEELINTVKESSVNSTLQIVHRNANQLLSLVNQILDFRRLEFGREKLLLSYGDIVALLADICDSFRLKAEKEKIRLTFTPSVEKVETMFDRDKTTKIMMNLLSNAFKFTDSGGAIGVGLDISDGQILISVADTGPGIPDADKDHIFERFYQSDKATRTSAGSGIGLHIVREYVRLQGGEISVHDQSEGQGSVFSFNIPLQKRNMSPANVYTAESPGFSLPETSDEPSEPGITLLIVDDNRDLLTYMSQSLGSEYIVLTATNGREALQELQQSDVNIIISDVVMPEMDGLELCRRVKTDIETSHIPVVLLTANTMTSDELQGLEAGADDYVTKPFSMDILRQRVRNLVERSQRQHERFAQEIDIEPSEITVTSLDEQFIARAISLVEQHISEPDFSVEQLSSDMGVHRSQLYKKLQHLTGKTPQQFIRILRLKRGRQLLEQSGLYVSEVAYKVGFNSPRIFSKYFKEEFGITPKDFTNSGDTPE